MHVQNRLLATLRNIKTIISLRNHLFFHIKIDNSWSSRHLICIESRPQSEVRWRSGWSQNPSCGHLLVQNNFSKTHHFRDMAVQNLLLSLQKPCIPTSMHPSCSNYEIIRFSIVKLTIPGGHDTSFASKIRPKTRYGRGPDGVFHAYFVPTPTPWTFSWCKTM